jgi:hypothetical protein
VTGPGLYRDMPAAEYHADPADEPSLSSSIAKLLIQKTPRHARAAHPRLNPEATRVGTKAMDFGSAAHEILLGRGSGLEICPFDNYTTQKARDWRDDVTLRGKIPLKQPELIAAIHVADAVRAALAEIPGAERAVMGGMGIAETVVIWRDNGDGPLCRAMPDWLDLDDGAIYDLKTTGTGLDDRSLNNLIAAADTAFDMRAAFYLRGLEQLEEVPPGRFVYRWIFVESGAPFEARVFEMDGITRDFGDRKARYAINKWHKCLTENRWPGYPRKIERPKYPAWAETAWLDRELELMVSTPMEAI